MKRSPLARYTRVNPRNRERAAKRWAAAYHSEAFVEWIHSLACSVSGKEGWEGDPVDVVHVRSRGAGGDWRMVVPMLQSLHGELHWTGQKTFQQKYGVDLELIAAAVHQRWRAFTK